MYYWHIEPFFRMIFLILLFVSSALALPKTYLLETTDQRDAGNVHDNLTTFVLVWHIYFL